MIDIETLVARFPALTRDDVERWIEMKWVCVDQGDEGYRFHEIDAARVDLILQLRDDMDVNEDALPIVLSLLDQLFDARRRLRDLDDALAEAAPDEVRRAIAERLLKRRA